MEAPARWWAAAPMIVVLVLAACGGDDGAPAAETGATGADVPATPAESVAAGTDAVVTEGATGTMSLDGEEIAMGPLRCYFEEQPRAGMGGQFTHTAQASGVNADGHPVVLDLSRARTEDGTVEDDIIVDIGDPFSDDAVSLMATGPEGLIAFGDAAAAAEDVEVSDFDSDPVTLSFDLDCG